MLRLDLTNPAGITDIFGNTLAASFSGGDLYLISEELQPPGSPTGWSPFGFTDFLAWPDYDPSTGAYLAHVAPDPIRYRVTGVMQNLANWLPYSAIGPDNVARGKFYVYAGGQGNPAELNQIPNFRARLSNRFAVNSMLEVFHHSNDSPAQTALETELRPSTLPTSPSLYTVDIDPIDVPQITMNPATEGVLAAFEAYALQPQENGYVALAESQQIVTTYPLLAISPVDPPIKTYAAADLAVFVPYELSLYNIIPSPFEGVPGTVDTTAGTIPTYQQGAFGITIDAAAVPSDRIGIGTRDFNPDQNTFNYAGRARVAEGKVYTVRYHMTSTQLTNRQAQVRMRARSIKFAWSQKLEVGGAWGTGGGLYPLNANNSIAQQSLPGVGCLNPDQGVAGEPGGWYTLIIHTPMDSAIRPEFPPGTPVSVSMPNISAQPGPGVAAQSRRDLLLGIDLVDTLSAGGGRALEKGNFTLDRIEVRVFDVGP